MTSLFGMSHPGIRVYYCVIDKDSFVAETFVCFYRAVRLDSPFPYYLQFYIKQFLSSRLAWLIDF